MRTALLIGLAVSPFAAQADALAWVEARIAKRHAVAQLSVADAQAALRAVPGDWLVLDVRESEECAVSRLPGAVRVAPQLSAKEFAARFADDIAGKHVLLYCSVGQRSSSLADRVTDVVESAGGQGVANLQGGIFRWQGEGGPLVNADGPTDAVHPYNRFWGLLRPGRPQQQ